MNLVSTLYDTLSFQFLNDPIKPFTVKLLRVATIKFQFLNDPIKPNTVNL